MSRCYPFPPPGYVRNETRDESLIGSIKGTKEEVKRDRKHNKDKKRKERDTEADNNESANASKKFDDGRGLVTNNELECLEKSSLTVELEQQTSSQNSCDSRPNHIQSPLLPDETSIRVLLHGKEHEHQDAEVMLTNKEHSESLAHTSANEAPLDPLIVCQEKRKREITTKLSKEKNRVSLESDRQISKPLGKETHQETAGASKLCRKCPSSTAVRFLDLIENWAPDLVESKLIDTEDQELWLVMKVGAKRHHHQVNNQTTSSGRSSMVWPTARFLPEAELHALPFTVPF
ncbi:BnaA07g03010D [Brassica napus]|uniref:BnaA07g03010D protein n=1 Tax=Brassica napus TaxID=3708 RepID=A0A078GG63_BRANA|nr:BnaA07g03010D [Brassica napus]